MRKTYWTVTIAIMGAGTSELYFKEYRNAKAEGLKDYRDMPVKHTVKAEKYDYLDACGIFED